MKYFLNYRKFFFKKKIKKFQELQNLLRLVLNAGEQAICDGQVQRPI